MAADTPKHWLHGGYSHPVTRLWQRGYSLRKSDFIYPIFVCDEADAKQEIPSMPEQYRWGVNRLSVEWLVVFGDNCVMSPVSTHFVGADRSADEEGVVVRVDIWCTD